MLIVLWIMGLLVPSYAQEPKTPNAAQQPKLLKNLVRLVEADSANETWSSTVQPGVATPLQLRVLEAAPEPDRQAELAVTTFSAQQPAGTSVPAMIRLIGAGSWERRVRLTFDAPRWIDAELLLEKLRRGTTYKGRLALSAGSLYHTWEITLVTPPGQGSFSAESIPPVKLVTIPPCRWLLLRLLHCDSTGRHLSFTLTNRSEAPFTRVRVRFEPAGTATNKSTASNLSIDSFSFSRDGKDLDLENRKGATNVQLLPQQQLTLAARVEPLAPGEYSGAFRFGAAEIPDETQEPKLPLAIQVRHHWALPLLVILLGSALGWFGSKYVVAARKTRALMRQVHALRARADDFARSVTFNRTWHCPTEATSLSLARVHVILSQLTDLSSSVLPILLKEEEITERCKDAERRIVGLESVRTTRLSIERCASGRPAVQKVIGDLLGSMHQILEGATFGDLQQAELTKLLQTAGTWASDDTFVQRYQDAIVKRLREDVPRTRQQIASVQPAPLSAQLEALFNQLPQEQDVKKETLVSKLEDNDQIVGKLNLLWRERHTPWVDTLVKNASDPLDDLFRLVDSEAWQHLDRNRSTMTFEKRAGNEKPEAYDIVILDLTSGAKELNNERLLFHPLHIAWRVALTTVHPEGRGLFFRVRQVLWRAAHKKANDARHSSEVNARIALTPGLRLMEYFPTAGQVEVTATLRWEGKGIPIDDSIKLDVVPDRKFHPGAAFSDWTEYAVIILGAGFAAATGISALYDATFGSFGQYLGLLSWAAGTGTGANLFKELGTTSTVGGRADAALPTATGASR